MSREGYTLGREDVLGHPALTDPDTGLANRLHFELVYRYMFQAGDRGMAFTIMLVAVGGERALDIDAEGLRRMGDTLQSTTRLSDLVAHVGGPRFAVLLLGTNLPGARIAADRIESALRETTAEPISIGIATFDPRMKHHGELLDAAESALEKARRAGGGVEMG